MFMYVISVASQPYKKNLQIVLQVEFKQNNCVSQQTGSTQVRTGAC